MDRKSITLDERQQLRIQIERIWDIIALGYLQYIFHTYDRWHEIFIWFIQNKIKGHKVREYFKNATPDGQGMMEPIRQILARIDGDKNKKLFRNDLRHGKN
jgi:hypothetical protein